MALTRRHGNSGAGVSGAVQRTMLNNNGENRVASITVNDLLPLSILPPPTSSLPSNPSTPPPLHFRSVIYSSVSVITACSKWESRRKEGLRDRTERER